MMGHRLDEAGVLKLRSDITSELQNSLRALSESVNTTTATEGTIIAVIKAEGNGQNRDMQALRRFYT